MALKAKSHMKIVFLKVIFNFTEKLMISQHSLSFFAPEGGVFQLLAHSTSYPPPPPSHPHPPTWLKQPILIGRLFLGFNRTPPRAK